jgi:cell division protein FtsB
MTQGSAMYLRWIALGLLVLAVALQLRLWVGQWGLGDVWRLEQRVEALKLENEARRQRNATLAADVLDLKQGEEGVEERARSELGMIRPVETFYQIVERAPAATDAAGRGGD